MPKKPVKVTINPAEVRLAHHFQVGLCDDPQCQCIHVNLADENQKPFAVAALSLEQVYAVMGDLCQYAAEIQVAILARSRSPIEQRKVNSESERADDGEGDQ